jgi:hypothetical protein
MSDHLRAAEKKCFTVHEANQTLPLVKAIVADIVHTFREVNERRERLTLVKGNRRSEASDPYREEVEQIEQELQRDVERLQEYVDELHALGVEPKNFVMGLVDFPTLIEGREAYLCWHLQEPEVLYWHELEAGFAGRQPLPPQAVASKRSSDVEPIEPSAAEGQPTAVEP